MKTARILLFIITLLFLSFSGYSQDQIITKLYQELVATINNHGIAVEYFSQRKNIRAKSIILVLDDYSTWSINTVNGKKNDDIFAYFIELDSKHEYELKIVKGVKDLLKGFILEVYYSRGSNDVIQKRFETADVLEALNHFIVGTPMNRKDVALSYLKNYVDSGWFDK